MEKTKQHNLNASMETEVTHTSALGMQMGRKQNKSKREWRAMRGGKFESDAALLKQS